MDRINTQRHLGSLTVVTVALVLVLSSCSALSRAPATRSLDAETYQEKVYASWLGQIIGNIYGLPHENAYIEEPGPETFPYGYSRNLDRLKEVGSAFSDDDTDFEYLYLLLMEKKGPEPKYADIAAMWKYHVRDAVWLANRGALSLMHYGLEPPLTGDSRYNPHWFQIDPQLINEVWAVTAPGMVPYAVQKSEWAARVTNDGWGVEPTMFYGAMYAEAFFSDDIDHLIETAVAAMPPESRFVATVRDMQALHHKYPSDWRAARQEMAKKYYHDEPEDSRTIWNANLNGAAGILALLYGQGDFQRTLDLSCAMGFDADNQAATMSGLLGVMHGLEGLPKDLLFPLPELGWKEPFNDLYKNVSRYDMPDAGLKDMARRMALQGEKIILARGGRVVERDGRRLYEIPSDAAFTAPLELPNAPDPYLEVGKPLDFQPVLSGAGRDTKWQVSLNEPVPGITFSDGRFTGTPEKPGVYSGIVTATSNGVSVTDTLRLLVRGRNLAADAKAVISSTRSTATVVRDSMWLSVPRSLYAASPDVLRDGTKQGRGSSFYSIDAGHRPKNDQYGYTWESPVELGLLGLSMGSMEENGGWFEQIQVEYQIDSGAWVPVGNLHITPDLPEGTEPYNKPHFVEYLLSFDRVATRGIRINGRAGNARHWSSKPSWFTSVTELTVHAPLPGL